ncbi:MAG: NAD(P)H-binding protein [Thermodesulfobacteriota bacterium]|nr:NAD(P)H-binding protein [Thermodesulfobacteriota bacterium]
MDHIKTTLKKFRYILLASGYRVRAMGRSIAKMADRPWGQDVNVELVKGDILDTDSLHRTVSGCDAIFYLFHSMISRKGAYRDADRIGAGNMVQAAEKQGEGHIIYLGRLGDIHHKNISLHLVL